MSTPLLDKKDAPVIPVDGSYLYSSGQSIQPLHRITKNYTFKEAWFSCFFARDSLENFLSKSVYTNAIRIMVEPANVLVETIKKIEQEGSDAKKYETKVGEFFVYELTKHLQEFESVFKAEFRQGNLFLATPKGAYDLRALITYGESLFPSNFKELFPKALKDVQDGARCLAFELYTASGFHFHRANESVVLKYLEVLTDGKTKPERNMGKYIEALEKAKAPKQITSCLRDLKNLHRNPLMHPEQSINELDDAISLLNAIQAAIRTMMKEVVKLSPAESSD